MAADAKNQATIDTAAKRAAEALVSLGVTALLAAVMERFSEGTLPQKDEDVVAPVRVRNYEKIDKNIQNERSAVENSTILPNGQKLWRIDGRGTDDIFENGFNARGEDTDLQNYVNTNSPSIFVGTSTNPNILQNPDFGLPGKYFYQIDCSGLEGVNVNQVYPTNPFSDEEEMAIIGKIPTESIIGAQQILPNGDLGSFIMNPNYGGNP